MFSTHTALLNGQERKRGFLGTTGHPDTIQADTPGVSIWLSPPTHCYTKSSPGQEATSLSSSRSPWLQARVAQDRLRRHQGPEMRPPAPCLLAPTPAARGPELRGPSCSLGRAARRTRGSGAGWATRSPSETTSAHGGPCEPPGCQYPRTTRVPCGPASEELADARRGEPSSRAKTETVGTRTQRPEGRGHQRWEGGAGENKGGEQTEGAGGGVHSAVNRPARSDVSGLAAAAAPRTAAFSLPLCPGPAPT